jgi:type IV secretory pathway VirJ component
MANLGILLLVLAGTSPGAADTTLLPDLPLVEARAPKPGATLAVLLSGDGDWAGFDKGLAAELNARGISVVGLKSRSWLRARPRKDSEIAGRDLGRILAAYLPAWRADSVLLIGYSRGANLSPFMLTRLAPELRGRVSLLALLSPTNALNFTFHEIDLISFRHRPDDVEVLPELRKLTGVRMLCVYGTRDTESLCPHADAVPMKIFALDQGHRMTSADEVARLILGARVPP